MAALDYSPGSSTQPPGWYVVKTTAGKIGVVLHHALGAIDLGASSNGTVTSAIQISSDTGQDLPSLLSASGPNIQNAFQALGATQKQATSFIVQADTAAGSDQGKPAVTGIFGFLSSILPTVGGSNTTQLLISPGGSANAFSGQQPVSTTPSGDVQSLGSTGSVTDVLSSIWQWLTTPGKWLRILEFVGGAVLIYLAVKGLTGIDVPNVAAVAGKVVK